MVPFSRVSVCGSRMNRFAIRSMALYGVEATFDGSRCNTGYLLLTNCLMKMSTSRKCQNNFFFFPRNFSRMKRSINCMPSNTSSARISNMPNQSFTSKSPVRTKKRIVPKSCIGSFIALYGFGTDYILILVGHLLGRKVCLTVLSSVPEWSRHMCCCD